MPATDTLTPFPAPMPASRDAGFVLGARWSRPGFKAPRRDAEVEANFLEGADTSQLLPVNRLEYAPAIFQGIITHYVDPELRPKLKESGDSLRLVEDLGLDSLSMVEVMMRVEDLLQIRVSDDELRHFRTLGEVREFVDRTARAMSAPLPPVLPAS